MFQPPAIYVILSTFPSPPTEWKIGSKERESFPSTTATYFDKNIEVLLGSLVKRKLSTQSIKTFYFRSCGRLTRGAGGNE